MDFKTSDAVGKMTENVQLVIVLRFSGCCGRKIVLGKFPAAEAVVVKLKASVYIKMADGIAEANLSQGIGPKTTVNRDFLFSIFDQVRHPHFIHHSKLWNGGNVEGQVAKASYVFPRFGIPVIQNPVERVTGPYRSLPGRIPHQVQHQAADDRLLLREGDISIEEFGSCQKRAGRFPLDQFSRIGRRIGELLVIENIKTANPPNTGRNRKVLYFAWYETLQINIAGAYIVDIGII